MRTLAALGATAAVAVLVTTGAGATRGLRTEPAFADLAPVVSPDGKRIAFLRSGITPASFVRVSSLYTVRLDGRGVIALTRGSVNSAANARLGHFDAVIGASWSPDGRRFVYARVYSATRYDFTHSELMVADADGANATPLTVTEPPDMFSASSPAWSAARNSIVFVGNDGLWTVDPTGRNLTRLTSGDDLDPAWSPDGARIAFIHSDSLTVIDADGSNRRQFAFPRANWPAWSPDGTRIALYGSRDGARNDIWVFDDDGTNLRRLTTNAADDITPTWTPDGKSIVFASTRGRGIYSSDLWIMNADGSKQRPLIPRAPQSASDGRRCTVTGTAVADILHGTAGADVLCAFAWDDRVFGFAGNDVLDGGTHRDLLDGGPGDDLILARDHRKDTVRGGPGFDRAQVDRGLDQVSGVEQIIP